ncbi:hypothetical protein TRAPUB_8074 [Trametes pubescens]|uniref:Uncharacterized protein n=1 Tax=Trametes pubescens TaxID=154538 RepID=A0A1M2W664_TRAPU|nr:hypothetical protein TRAPUB_8074 [Trametes pubescens]
MGAACPAASFPVWAVHSPGLPPARRVSGRAVRAHRLPAMWWTDRRSRERKRGAPSVRAGRDGPLGAHQAGIGERHEWATCCARRWTRAEVQDTQVLHGWEIEAVRICGRPGDAD